MELTPRMRERLDRWSREGAETDEIGQQRVLLERRRPLIESLREGRGGTVEIERLAETSAWVEPAAVRVGMEELSPQAIVHRLSDALDADDGLDELFETLAADPFPSEEFLAELYGWAHGDTHPIHSPWTIEGLDFFDYAQLAWYEAERAAFATLSEALSEEGRAAPDLPVAYELDALLQRLAGVDLQGITTEDVSVLGFAKGDPDDVGGAERRDLDHLWGKVQRLVDSLAGRLFGEDGYDAALWPWHGDGATFPFLWARIKAAGHGDAATHLGLFVSAGHCNVCIDLEKDLVDAGSSTESVSDVLDFYRDGLGGALPDDTPGHLEVWTDPDNVLPIREFLGADLDEFMAANEDPEHPWPRLGSLLEINEITGFGGAWVDEMEARMTLLVPVYRAMVEGFTG